MTPAEWLAAILLGNIVFTLVWDICDRDAVTIKYNSVFRAVWSLCIIVTLIVLALVVLI